MWFTTSSLFTKSNDEFTTHPHNNNEDSSSFEYDYVDKQYNPSTNNCVFDCESNEPTKVSENNDKPPSIAIILTVVIIVVVVVIIIVIVVVCVKKRKNIERNRSSEENEL